MDDACALGWGEDMTQAMVVGAKAAGHHLCWMWKAELQETNVAGKKLEWAKLEMMRTQPGERSDTHFIFGFYIPDIT